MQSRGKKRNVTRHRGKDANSSSTSKKKIKTAGEVKPHGPGQQEMIPHKVAEPSQLVSSNVAPSPSPSPSPSVPINPFTLDNIPVLTRSLCNRLSHDQIEFILGKYQVGTLQDAIHLAIVLEHCHLSGLPIHETAEGDLHRVLIRGALNGIDYNSFRLDDAMRIRDYTLICLHYQQPSPPDSSHDQWFLSGKTSVLRKFFALQTGLSAKLFTLDAILHAYHIRALHSLQPTAIGQRYLFLKAIPMSCRFGLLDFYRWVDNRPSEYDDISWARRFEDKKKHPAEESILVLSADPWDIIEEKPLPADAVNSPLRVTSEVDMFFTRSPLLNLHSGAPSSDPRAAREKWLLERRAALEAKHGIVLLRNRAADLRDYFRLIAHQCEAPETPKIDELECNKYTHETFSRLGASGNTALLYRTIHEANDRNLLPLVQGLSVARFRSVVCWFLDDSYRGVEHWVLIQKERQSLLKNASNVLMEDLDWSQPFQITYGSLLNGFTWYSPLELSTCWNSLEGFVRPEGKGTFDIAGVKVLRETLIRVLQNSTPTSLPSSTSSTSSASSEQSQKWRNPDHLLATPLERVEASAMQTDSLSSMPRADSKMSVAPNLDDNEIDDEDVWELTAAGRAELNLSAGSFSISRQSGPNGNVFQISHSSTPSRDPRRGVYYRRGGVPDVSRMPTATAAPIPARESTPSTGFPAPAAPLAAAMSSAPFVSTTSAPAIPPVPASAPAMPTPVRAAAPAVPRISRRRTTMRPGERDGIPPRGASVPQFNPFDAIPSLLRSIFFEEVKLFSTLTTPNSTSPSTSGSRSSSPSLSRGSPAGSLAGSLAGSSARSSTSSSATPSVNLLSPKPTYDLLCDPFEFVKCKFITEAFFEQLRTLVSTIEFGLLRVKHQTEKDARLLANYSALPASQQAQVRDFAELLFFTGCFARGWQGPPHPPPISSAASQHGDEIKPGKKMKPALLRLHTFIKTCDESINKCLFQEWEWVLYKKGRMERKTTSPLSFVEVILEGKFCIREASAWLMSTGIHVMRVIGYRSAAGITELDDESLDEVR